MSKILLVVLAMVTFRSAAFAEDAETVFKMPSGTDTLYLVQDVRLAEVQAVTPKDCGPNARCAVVSTAVLQIRLNGCVDKLGPVTAQTFTENGKFVLAISALGVLNPESMVVLCKASNVQTVKMTIGFGIIGKDQVEVRVPAALQ
jgi:hypothetical protein